MRLTLPTALMFVALAHAAPAQIFLGPSPVEISVQQVNVADGTGRFVPAVQIMTGNHFSVIRLGEQDLTRSIFYDVAAFHAWVVAHFGQSPLALITFVSPPATDHAAAPADDDPGETPVICDPSHQDCPDPFDNP